VAKDKKKKKDKKAAKGGSTLKSLSQNPWVADVVAAALVATAAALKDSKRARALATDAGDELSRMSKAGAKQGEAMWDMALQIGRRSLESLISGNDALKSAKPKAKAKTVKPAAKPKVAKAEAKPKAAKPAAKKAAKKKPTATAGKR